MSLLRLWGQSSRFFNFGTISNSSVIEHQVLLISTRLSLRTKDAQSLLSLAGDRNEKVGGKSEESNVLKGFSPSLCIGHRV